MSDIKQRPHWMSHPLTNCRKISSAQESHTLISACEAGNAPIGGHSTGRLIAACVAEHKSSSKHALLTGHTEGIHHTRGIRSATIPATPLLYLLAAAA